MLLAVSKESISLSACHCFLGFTANFRGNVLQHAAADLRELATHIHAVRTNNYTWAATNIGLYRLSFMATNFCAQ